MSKKSQLQIRLEKKITELEQQQETKLNDKNTLVSEMETVNKIIQTLINLIENE